MLSAPPPVLRRVAAIGAMFLSLAAADVEAQRGDGVYRRWDHDVVFGLEVGGGVWLDGRAAAPAMQVALRARIADAAGPVVAYRWTGGDDGDALFVGVELRPLWPAIFLTDNATGREWLDLFLQSFAVELGASIVPLGTGGERGVGLGIGLSIDLPLLLPTKTRGSFHGLALRLGARRVDATAQFASTPDGVDRSGWLLSASLTAALGGGAGPSAEPRRYRVP